MRINELRIGNLLYNDGVVVTIDARTIFDIWDDKGLKNYKPIPLTEEWLLKFGFGKELDNFFRINKSNLIEILFHDNGVLVTTQSVCLNHIKKVHQLQNVFFALTNEEL